MTQRVLAFPGGGCLYFRRGRCLREERLNPGLEQGWRCVVLLAWGEAYDDFLDKVEAFSLSDETALAIWRRRQEGLIGPRACCADYRPAPNLGAPEEAFPEEAVAEGEEPLVAVGCLHGLEDMCLARLPRCDGVCASYKPRRGAPALHRMSP